MRALRTYVSFIMVFGILFGLMVAVCTAPFGDSGSAGLLAGLVRGGVIGGFTAVALVIFDRVGDRQARPGEPHGPRQGATVLVDGGADLPDRIKDSLRTLPAEIRDADIIDGRFTARTKWTWRSFGEEVTVQVTGDPGSPVAQISSRPVVRTALIDYGKGRLNVHRVAAALQEGSAPGASRIDSGDPC